MNLDNIEIDEAAIAGLVHEPGVRRDVRRRADRVVQAARQSAPVHTGRYRDSIHAEDEADGSVLVVADVSYGLYVEHGTREHGHPAHFTLTTALDAAGDAP